jgi:uncharacterized protein YhfF
MGDGGGAMSKQADVEAFWQAYLASLPAGSEPPAEPDDVWYFADNEETADELAGLVMAGIKTATCSSLWVCEAENEAPPKVGDLSIVTNWAGDPLCIIETTEIQIRPFDEVDEQFAYEEGEGDRTLAYWRRVHVEFFTRELAEIGMKPTETMPLVCERFRKVFP